MKKTMKLMALVMVLTMAISANALACSPAYKPLSEYGYTGVPKVEVELSDETKDSIDQYVKDYIAKCVLDKPVVNSALIWTKSFPKKTYISSVVTWDPVEGATSYKVEIKKDDGTSKVYDTEHNWMNVNSYSDEFITELDGATVRVRAYGDNETFSPWSDWKSMEYIR